jgi:hypothetical protein
MHQMQKTQPLDDGAVQMDELKAIDVDGWVET